MTRALFRRSILIVVLCVACGGGRPAVERDLTEGKRIYQAYGCAACHGAEGRGDGPGATNPRPRDFREASAFKFGHTIDAVSATIVAGRGAMPSFSYVPDAERRELAAYVISLADSKGQKR